MKETRSYAVVPMTDLEIRDSGQGNGFVSLTGNAAVFNRRSHVLGYCREVIMPGAFKRVLDDPALLCHLVVNHDMSKPVASTQSREAKLELRETPDSLRSFARFKPLTTHARDAVEDIKSGLMTQMSFAFTMGEGDYTMVAEDDGEIVRYVNNIRELFDVSICAQGAYPQTDVVARSLLEGADSETLARAITAFFATAIPNLAAPVADLRAADALVEQQPQSPDPAAQADPADEVTAVPVDAEQEDAPVVPAADVEEGADASDAVVPTEDEERARRARDLAIARARFAVAKALEPIPQGPTTP